MEIWRVVQLVVKLVFIKFHGLEFRVWCSGSRVKGLGGREKHLADVGLGAEGEHPVPGEVPEPPEDAPAHAHQREEDDLPPARHAPTIA